MKSIIKRLTTAALALSAVALSIPEIYAADVRLEGLAGYAFNSSDAFFNRAPKQTGRYKSLGSDYYHKAEISSEFISNLSGSRSGSLSFELWAMSYYGATSGVVLMTRGVSSLRGGRSFDDVTAYGNAVSLDERKFPELNLWEYTRSGWRNRDHLTFQDDDYL